MIISTVTQKCYCGMALLQNEVVNTLLTIAEKADSRNTDIGQG